MTGYQVKTVLKDYTLVFGYGITQDDAISNLVDKVKDYYDTFEIIQEYNIVTSNDNWNYKEKDVVYV
jgi:hypothetical protein